MKRFKKKAIFFDTGKRWKKIKHISLVFHLILIVIFGVGVYAYLYSPFQINNTRLNDPVIDKKIEEINNVERKVINQGTFITLQDVYGTPYIKRFGEEKKRVVLTFDDGPDPAVTPRILHVLSKEKVKGTFFVVGSQVYKYPEIGHDIIKQGSDIGLHTFSHYENRNDEELSKLTFLRELDFTEKLFSHLYGYKTKIFRVPYLGLEDKLSYNSLQYIREAHKRDLLISGPTVDAEDWNSLYTYQKITKLATTSDVQTVVLLLHDAGGNRNATIKALPQIIKFYRDRGYTFSTISELAYEQGLIYKEQLNIADRFTSFLTYTFYDLYKKSPHFLEKGFIVSFFFVIIHMTLFIILAFIQKYLRKVQYRKRQKEKTELQKNLISVVIPMHNEEKVIKPTIRAILRSSYKNFELLVINDGSTDESLSRAKELTQDSRVKIFTKNSGGKFSALNYGLKQVKGEIVVFIDADTRVTSSALRKIVQAFHNSRIGAVAGNIQVGNKKNLLSKLQNLEYALGQGIEKRAFDLFGTVMVVPGAFGAWRTKAIRKVGGFSYKTHAEDFDLTLSIIKKGYRVHFCEESVAYTEAPLTLKQFFIQRFRWNFGNLQVFFKHRDMIFNRKFGILGLFLLPRSVFIQIPAILLTPFVDFLAIGNIIMGNRGLTVIFLVLYTISNVLITIIACYLTDQKYKDIFVIPFIRFPYTQFLYGVLYIALIHALKGEIVTWSKLNHQGRLSIAK